MKKIYISFALVAFVLTSWSQEYRRMIADGSYTVQEIQKEAKKYFNSVGTERGKGYKQYRRWEYNAMRLMDENGKLKTAGYYYNELERYNNYVNQNFDLSRTTVGNWITEGPTDWNATSGWNPGVGRITSLAIDPGNTDHIIIGGHTGGVWKTTNGGTSWTVLTDNLSNLSVNSLAMDPTNSSTYFWGSTNGTIFKSTDAGMTWNVLATAGTGWVNKILIDPTNTAKMYCSTEFSGLYKSTDSGATWTLIDPGMTTGYDFEFKPGDTNTIYASGNNFYVSTDGGATFTDPSPDPLIPWGQEYVNGSHDWTQASANEGGLVTPKTGAGMAYFQINNYSAPVTILTSPAMDISGAASPELKFSFTQPIWSGPGYDDQDELRVLYKTSMAGAWMELAAYDTSVTTWTDITLALPAGSADYYIGFEGSANYGFGITLDDVSVEDATLGVIFEDGFENPAGGFSTGPKMIGVSKDATGPDAAVVYVLEAAGSIFGAFYKSTDSGVTFSKLDHGTNNYFGYSSTANDNSGQAPRDMDIAVHPTNVDEVHIAGILTWRSIDGGSSFDITSQWVPANAANEDIGYCHADVDIMEFVGNDLYVGTDGGIFVATDTGTINSTYYTDLTAGLGIRQFYKIGISQSDPVIVTGGSQDNGTSVLSGAGAWTDWLGADGMETFVDKSINSIMYGTSQYGSFYKTINGGTTVDFGAITQPDGKGGQNVWNWIVPFEQDPIVQDVIYCAFDEVYKSINGGGSWTSISQNFAALIDELKVVPTNSNILYASIDGALYKTTDGGATAWTALTGFSGNINSIALHPTDPMKIAIATTSADKVFVSNDAGATWSSYLNNLPGFSAQTVVWQNNADNGLYVGMNYGIYYIDDSFAVWQPFSNGLPNVDIRELEINTANNRIYAASYGRGLWSSGVFDPTLSTQEFDLQSILVFPNPASNEINLKWNKNDEIGIKIYNSLGKLMYSEENQSIMNTYKIDVSNYASGLYFVSMNNSNGILTKKVIIE